MSVFSKRLMMPTDVAHIVVFHPDDLSHCSSWPIAWYAEPFVFPIESAEGRLIAWCTKSDGDFAVRVTDGELTERERKYAGGSWIFPYSVKHGRVYLDNTDALPGVEQMSQTSEYENYWIDVLNGDYAVQVTGIQWDAEPGAEAEDFDTLPNYVVRFTPLEDQTIAPAKRPPDITSSMDAGASDDVFMASGATEVAVPVDTWLPAFASKNVCPSEQEFQSKGDVPISAVVRGDEGGFEIFDKQFVVAAAPDDLIVGGLAILSSIHGTSSEEGQATCYSMSGHRIVRITAINGMFRDGQWQALPKNGVFGFGQPFLPDDALVAVTVEIVVRDNDLLVPSIKGIAETVQAIQQSLTGDGQLAQLLGAVANYEQLRIQSMDSVEEVSHWLLTHLPNTAKERIRISALPLTECFNALKARFDGLTQSDFNNN